MSFFLKLVLPIFALAPLASALSHQASAPFAADIRAFQIQDQAHPPQKGRILFLGSSSFTRWRTMQAAFPNHPLINRAFGGSTLLDEARYVDEIVNPYAPKEVVMYCGENDFAAEPNLDPATVVGRFESLFVMIRHRTGDVPFVYISMKPSPSRWYLAPKFRAANAGIQTFLATQPHTAFVNIFDVMLKNGKPNPAIYVSDELHMNANGYKLWIPLIHKTLR